MHGGPVVGGVPLMMPLPTLISLGRGMMGYTVKLQGSVLWQAGLHTHSGKIKIGNNENFITNL